MSLGHELKLIYLDAHKKREEERIKNEAEIRKKADVWVNEVLRPYLMEHAHLGQVRVYSATFLELEDPIYREVLRSVDLKVSMLCNDEFIIEWK